MSRKLLAVALVIILGVSLAGCVTESGYYDPYRSAGAGALGGAATGAALGAIIGAATGAPATGAWIGAAAGALAGGVGAALYAQHRNSEIRSAQAAAQSYNYSPAAGSSVVAIDRAYASPSVVSPGQQVGLSMDYTILTPDNYPASVNLVREVRYRGTPVGSPYSTSVTNNNGSYTDTVMFGVSPQAGPGTYEVVSRVVSSYGSSERVSYFTVQ